MTTPPLNQHPILAATTCQTADIVERRTAPDAAPASIEAGGSQTPATVGADARSGMSSREASSFLTSVNLPTLAQVHARYVTPLFTDTCPVRPSPAPTTGWKRVPPRGAGRAA